MEARPPKYCEDISTRKLLSCIDSLYSHAREFRPGYPAYAKKLTRPLSHGIKERDREIAALRAELEALKATLPAIDREDQ